MRLPPSRPRHICPLPDTMTLKSVSDDVDVQAERTSVLKPGARSWDGIRTPECSRMQQNASPELQWDLFLMPCRTYAE